MDNVTRDLKALGVKDLVREDEKQTRMVSDGEGCKNLIMTRPPVLSIFKTLWMPLATATRKIQT